MIELLVATGHALVCIAHRAGATYLEALITSLSLASLRLCRDRRLLL